MLFNVFVVLEGVTMGIGQKEGRRVASHVSGNLSVSPTSQPPVGLTTHTSTQVVCSFTGSIAFSPAPAPLPH